MAHKTLIGGTAYEIKGGRTLIGGTGYSIKSGKTLVNGTGYNISFGKKYTIPAKFVPYNIRTTDVSASETDTGQSKVATSGSTCTGFTQTHSTANWNNNRIFDIAEFPSELRNKTFNVKSFSINCGAHCQVSARGYSQTYTVTDINSFLQAFCSHVTRLTISDHYGESQYDVNGVTIGITTSSFQWGANATLPLYSGSTSGRLMYLDGGAEITFTV